MTDFDKAFDRLMGNEGGYVNNPNDPGGETMWGITKRVAVANGYAGAMRSLPRQQAKDITYQAYWLASGCDKLPFAIAFQFLDAVYNHGYGNAARMLQRAAGVADDGSIGKVTLDAVSAKSVTDLLALFNAERLRFYTKLSTWPNFGKGWANRIADNLRLSAQDT